MGKPSVTTHKAVWLYRKDDEDLRKLKNLLGLRNETNATTPDALGEAIRLAVKQLEKEA
jgi:hypothetical protein